MLPYALMLGMTEGQFWHSNPKLMKPYVKAHELKVEEMDRQAHIQGAYFLHALMTALDKSFNGKKASTEYPELPFTSRHIPRNEKEEKEHAIEDFLERERKMREKWKQKKLATKVGD